MIPGIDVSKWQGVINWAQVAPSGVQWAVARASLGHTYIDSQYANNSRGMRDHNILRGAYHVLTPNMSTDDEIRNFESALSKGPKPDFCVLDVELDKGQTPNTIGNRVHAMLVAIEDLGYKHKTFIYTAAWFWNPKVGGGRLVTGSYKPLPSDWVLWVADYGANDGQVPARMPILPNGWDKWHVWQYTTRGKVPGINASVDMNIMKDGYFAQLGGDNGEPPPPPPPPPPPSDLEERVEEVELQVGNIKRWGEKFPV